MTDTPEKIVYTASATSTGGRDGRVRTDDGTLDLQLTRPGAKGDGTNPEQLFAAGYAGCFTSALLKAARNQGLDPEGSEVTARVGLGPEGESFAITVELEVRLPGQPADVAQGLAEAAHRLCPYSKATRGNVPVTLTGVAG